jgi:hydroxymethylpyrimidine pyrophosphatase-like HAD family hydrolase
MIMPKGINKESGLLEALRLLGIRKENAACIGDAENDLALFRACGYRAAVANAVGLLKEKANFICSKQYGEGVEDFVELVLGGV